jgi:hypothetical protein
MQAIRVKDDTAHSLYWAEVSTPALAADFCFNQN